MKRKTIARAWPWIWLGAAVVAGACACAPEALFEGMIGADTTAPVFLSARMPTDRELVLNFSESVELTSYRFDPDLEIEAVSSDAADIRVSFARPLVPGFRYALDVVAEDVEGNTLAVFAPFLGRNDRPPKAIINELRTEYDKPKVEFVELLVQEAGSLGGVTIGTTVGGILNPVYTFPPVEVAAGEYVVLHLRTVEEGCVDEIGERSASGGVDASSGARDFWVPGNEERLRKSDAVVLLDCDSLPIDAVLFAESGEGEWKNEALREAAQFLAQTQAWSCVAGSGPPGPADAASSEGVTGTRTLCRSPAGADTDCRSDWRVVATGGATPGKPNAATVYAKKK